MLLAAFAAAARSSDVHGADASVLAASPGLGDERRAAGLSHAPSRQRQLKR